jgi:hypothetical protein
MMTRQRDVSLGGEVKERAFSNAAIQMSMKLHLGQLLHKLFESAATVLVIIHNKGNGFGVLLRQNRIICEVTTRDTPQNLGNLGICPKICNSRLRFHM